MAINRLPSWFVVGILIYPLLILVGLVFSFITSGDFNFMYWLYIPSMMFDQMFKECCTEIAGNQRIMLISGVLFWFIIGSILGLIVKIVCSSSLISKEEIMIEENREKDLEKKPEEKKEETKEAAPSEELKYEETPREEVKSKQQDKEEEKKEEKTEVKSEETAKKREKLKKQKSKPNKK